MNKNILNKNGTAIIGLLVSVLLIALVFVGSFYFYNEVGDDVVEGDIVDVYQEVQNDISGINKNIESRNQDILSEEKASSSVEIK